MGNKQNVSNAAVRALLTLIGERLDAEVLGKAPSELKGQKLKASLYEEFDGKCAYCSIKLDEDFDVEHIVPINKANLGMQMYGNLAPSCKFCNADKKSMPLREYLEKFHPTTAETTFTYLSDRAAKWGADLDASNIRKLVEDFYQEISILVLDKSEQAMKLLGGSTKLSESASKEIRRKADYDFSEIARLFPVGAFVKATLDGKIGEVIDYSLEGQIGNRKPHVKFYVAEEDKAYRRSPNQIELIRRLP